MSPIKNRDQFIEVIKNYLEVGGINTFDDFLALQFKKGKLVDGEQNIDTFINKCLKI